jgi:hypothetical protein
MPVPANRRTTNVSSGPIRLVDLLRQIPAQELESLIQRLKIRVDEAKKIDVPSQVARILLQLQELRDPTILPGPTRELLYRIAEAGGVLSARTLPGALEPLVARGVVFVRGGNGGVELLLPIAHLLQLKPWEGEDPRGLRALLHQAHPEVASSIAGHYLGRPANPPLALSLEPAWEVVSDPERLAREVEELAPLERKLLSAVEHVGGEVDTEELLDLEREPLRLRGAMGATPSRRGVGFALERRAFLVPVHPNRHVIPTEVAAVVGAHRRAEREAQRQQIRLFVLEEDHAPRRARFAEDPAPLALAMALSVRDPGVEVKPGIGTPRSLVTKFASRFGRDVEQVGFIAALSRAIGLWDPSALGTAAPPGSLLVSDLGRALFNTWRRGGAWDEARADGEVLRAAPEHRESSSAGVIREIVLEALNELAGGRWVPWEAIAAYVRSDSRTPGVQRLVERWAQRAGATVVPTDELASRIAFESLHLLGVVDLGDADDEAGFGPTLRITPRGRAYLQDSPESRPGETSRFLDHQSLRLGGSTQVGSVIALAPFVEIGGVSSGLDVLVTPQAMSHALSAGFEADVLQARLEVVAQLPDPIARALAQASAVLGRAEFVATAGFLWVEDPEVRELLRTRRQTVDLFVDPSPPSGLLVQPGVDLERLARRCRSLGVELLVGGEVYRTRSIPPGKGSGARRLESNSTLPAVRAVRAPSSTRSPSVRPPSGRAQSSRPPPADAPLLGTKRGGGSSD